MRAFRIVIWLDEHNKKLYWKKIIGHRCNYIPGQVNQYNHILIMVIESSNIDNYGKNIINKKFPILLKIGKKLRKGQYENDRISY